MTSTAAPVRNHSARPGKIRQMPGLDGLRALAVVAVIVYHLDPSWLPGGFLGVDIFFVISGYLITSLLMTEWTRTRRVALVDFWKRRARRLLPAAVTMVVLVTLAASVVARDGLARLQGDVPAAFFYVMNWRLLVNHDSYIASLGRPPLLQHLWSLAVEEQFYLLWPPVLILLRRRLKGSQIALVALGGAILSATAMAVLYHPGGDPSSVYFGTDTHADGLLLGCALAAALPPGKMAAAVTSKARRVLEHSGVFALIAVVVGLATLGFHSSATYRGGMFMVDVATAVVVASVAHPASRLGAALSRQPLQWVGQRSYSLYLWHWPIFEMTRPGVDIGATGWPVLLLRLSLTAAAAELSYRYVEQPWRTGRAQEAAARWVARTEAPRLAGTLVLPVVALVAVLATAPAQISPPILLEGATAAARTSPTSQLAISPASVGPTTTTTLTTTTVTTATATTTPSAPPISAFEPILAIGDSVLLAASPQLSTRYGAEITIDAAVGRQVYVGVDRLAEYRASGALAKYRTVLIDLGTNGAFEPSQFAELAQILAAVPRVVVYNVHADRSWAATSNATISSGVAAHPAQMRLADWNTTVDAPGLLYPDGIHPDEAGSQAYIQLLQAALP